ncbi:MAG: Ig-like domain-containing protein, partial [Candidatus Paceibacterota bacterium]
VGPLNEDSEFELTCTGEGGSDSDVVFVSVAGPNTQPNASDDSYTNRQCGSTYNFYVLGNDYDPDGDAINVNRVYSSSDGVSPSNRTSYIRYTVPSDFDGFDYFRYRIVDEHGAYDSGSYAYVWLSGDSCQKEDPVAVNDSVSMRCGDTKYINVVSNDYDPDGGDVDLISVGSASHGSASRYNDTYARYSAPDEYSGSDSFSYTIEDDEGATDTGSVSVSIACEATSVDIDASPKTIYYGESTTVTWTVSGDVDWCSASGTTGDWSGYKSTSGGSENVGPIWREGNVRATLTCDGPGGRKADTVWITVLEPSNPPSVSLSVSPSSVGYGDPSTLSWTASGEVDSCTATGDWSGSKSTSDSESTGSQYDDSSYTLSCTGPGGSGSDTEEVDVGAQNQSPTANFSYSTDGLDVDFTDQSSDSDGSITAHSWNFGDEGTSSATNPSHDYSSAGTYSVTLTVTDNDGATDSHTEDVSVDQPNRSPHAEGDSESVWENSSNNPLSVLSNDSDPDGDSLDVSRIISQPSHGTVSISGDDILYTPDNGYTGSDSFSYRATDGSLESNTAQVSITVQAAEDYSMQLSPSSVELSENTSGTSDTVTITIVRINGFDGTVNLSIDSGGTSPELSGAGYNFSDSTLTGSETQSTLVVTVSNPLDPGTYTVRVQASSSELGNRYRSFDINVDSSIDPEYEEF